MDGGLAVAFSASINCRADSIRLLGVVGSEFHQQRASAGGQKFQVRRSFAFQAINDASFKTFEADWD